METKRFKTKTEFIERANVSEGFDAWLIALDVGYSAVKGFAPNKIFRFPSYAKQVASDITSLAQPKDSDIKFFNCETGEYWLVGEAAQNLIDDKDTSDNSKTLYNRNRYATPLFDVLVKVGLGMGLMNNKLGHYVDGQPIYVQSGLPEMYKDDKAKLMKAICKHHHFKMSIGNGKMQEFNFVISPENAHITSQPLGTLFSVSFNSDCKYADKNVNYMDKNVLIFDGGFGTLDIFPIKKGIPETGDTYPNLGMRRVLQETCDSIKAEFGTDIPVHAMQKYLETGEVKYIDEDTLASGFKSFGEILNKSSKKVCDEALKLILAEYRIVDYDYFIITGGTGAAWSDEIRGRFKNLSTLQIVSGGLNDNISTVYANVRGYYLFRAQTLKNLAKKAA